MWHFNLLGKVKHSMRPYIHEVQTEGDEGNKISYVFVDSIVFKH